MTADDSPRIPTSSELRVFAVAILLFAGLVAALTMLRPDGVAGAAGFCSIAWLSSFIFNRNLARADHAVGLAVPGLLAAAWLGSRVAPLATAASLVFLGLAGLAVVWSSPLAGRRAYAGWMTAVAPEAWLVMTVVLATVFYAFITPIGLMMRLIGRDAMKRKLDRSASCYWIQRRPQSERARYFRQS